MMFNYNIQKKYIFKKFNSFKIFLFLNLLFLIINLLLTQLFVYYFNVNHLLSQISIIIFFSPIYYLIMKNINKSNTRNLF